jgi:hypothetical protein
LKLYIIAFGISVKSVTDCICGISVGHGENLRIGRMDDFIEAVVDFGPNVLIDVDLQTLQLKHFVSS